ncbi:MAG: sodium-dependent transporter, partial [Clostridia bacterium]|nr:sodium-dependent transporter [Clostridia bacterium]
VLVAEMYLGRRAQANPVTAYAKTNKKLGFIGLLVIVIPFLIICYYSVLGGWTFKFAANSFQPIEQATNASSTFFGAFISNAFEPVFYTLIFMLLAGVIIMAGVKGGIEKASKVLMPTLFILLVIVAVYCLCLGGGVSKGLDFYLNPDFSALGFDGVLAAMGQAFYSLSLGMGIMVSYGSYTGEDIKIGKSIDMIAVFDNLVSLISGLAIFSAVGALKPELLGTDALGGVTLMYTVLPQIFAQMGGFGQVVSFLFFAMVVIAALTSVISLLEVATQFVIQKFKVLRRKATLILCGACFLLSIPIAWSVGGAFNGAITLFGFDLLTFLDEMTNTVLMPVGALFSCIAIGWFIDKSTSLKARISPMNTYRALENDGLHLGGFGKVFAFMVKYVGPLLILFVEIFGVIGKVNQNGTHYWWVIVFSLMLILISLVVYFVFFNNKDTGCNQDELVIEESAKKE